MDSLPTTQKNATLPNEIMNYIFVFRMKDPVFLLFQKFLAFHLFFEDKESGQAYSGENYLARFCHHLSFHQWYCGFWKHKRQCRHLSFSLQ